MPGASAATNEPPSQELPLGTRLEEFIIERVLGSGGFGITYLARDKRLGRQVVIKENLPAQFCWRDTTSLTVQPRQSSGEDADNFQYSLESFEKEAATLASLDHPGIVKVLRSFEANGTAYFVMPFVEGTTFDKMVRGHETQRRPFTEAELGPLLDKVLDALAYLHDRGIYHRDIKPGNLLITAKGDPVLIDFGAARQRLSERSLTVIESPGYTPFEQMQSRGKVGPWSDLYALGGTFYKAITGETPAKAADRILEDGVVPLAQRRELEERFSQGLLQSIDHAMRPKLSERPQSAADWAGRLRGSPFQLLQATEPKQSAKTDISAERSVLTSIPTKVAEAVGEVPQKSTRRGDLIWMWGGVVALGLILAGFAYLVTRNRPNQFAQPAQTATDASADASKPPQTAVDASADASKPPQTIDDTFASTSKTAPYKNTIGMAFVPAGTPGVLFSVWEARVKDFKAFVEETGHDAISDNAFGAPASSLEKTADGKTIDWLQKGGSWIDPRFLVEQTGEHPVVCVSYLDAEAFCAWLTKRERAAGAIPQTASYRLPTDSEWSRAVGDSEFPWGENFPPDSKDGNYIGEEAMVGDLEGFSSEMVEAGRRDSAARTAPVGMFKQNHFGLYDMGGNVYEWCSSWYTSDLNDAEAKKNYPWLVEEIDGQTYRVLRGSSWHYGERVHLRSEFRLNGDPRTRNVNLGFRIVLVVSGG
jgi:serine/threonine protein kinase/formylglycine-generating enzyme required for sulfatase activity